MFGEIQFELSSFHTLLLFLIVGGIIYILFLEIKKIKIQLEQIVNNKDVSNKKNNEPIIPLNNFSINKSNKNTNNIPQGSDP